MIEIIFWVSVFFVAYPYLFYPLIIAVVGHIYPCTIARRDVTPSVTILIPAYNEARVIRATVQNKLEQDYAGPLEVIVISDASDDGTDEIVMEFESRVVKLLRRQVREGKAAAINEAVQHANGDIIIFSDANSIFSSDAVRRIVMNFADPAIGYVTGAIGFVGKEGTIGVDGIDAYMRFENMLRRAETSAGSIIGVNGGVDAIRRELYSDIPKSLITDFVLPLRVIAKGFRVVFDEGALSSEVANTEVASEFRMRVRVSMRAMQGLLHMRQLLNPLKFPVVAFSIFSHKVLRYFGYVFLICAFLSNFILARSSLMYGGIFIFHIVGYSLALIGLTLSLPGWAKKITVVPSYLFLSYCAFAVATFKFLRGETYATWQPRGG